MTSRHICRCFALVVFFAPIAYRALAAQEQQPEPKKYMTAQQRLSAAKTVYLRNLGGTELPFNIIQAGIESWPRYVIVNSPEKADLLIEVLAPEETTSKVTTDAKSEKSRSSASSDYQFASVQIIRMTVSDAKTKVVLFAATEKPKDAWKEKARTESQIECAQKLLAAFRNRVEPENSQLTSK